MSAQNYDDDLFDSRRDYKNQYSTFIEELEESTQKLMNEVFNSEYSPDLNQEEQTSVQKLANSANSKNGLSGSKKSVNHKTSSGTPKQQMSQSFRRFLKRNDKWKETKLQRAKREISLKEEEELSGLTFIPQILRASREKIQPIYERCLELQKSKEVKLAAKRVEQQKINTQRESEQLTFQPQIKTRAKNRTLEEYLQDKEDWNLRKKEFIENNKIVSDARKYEECIFQPILVAKYKQSKTGSQSEKVEDRLIRTLEKKSEKSQG